MTDVGERHPTRWRKGQSGNPRGRPKSDFTLRELAQKHAAEGLQRLVDIMRNPATKPETVATVVGMIWDRGFGKAPAAFDVKHEVGFTEQFEDFIRELSSGQPQKVEVIDVAPTLIRRANPLRSSWASRAASNVLGAGGDSLRMKAARPTIARHDPARALELVLLGSRR